MIAAPKKYDRQHGQKRTRKIETFIGAKLLLGDTPGKMDRPNEPHKSLS